MSTYLTEWPEGTMEITVTYNLPDYMDPTIVIPARRIRRGARRLAGGRPDLDPARRQIASTVDDDQRASLAQDIQRTSTPPAPTSR